VVLLAATSCLDIEGALDRRPDIKTGAIGNQPPADWRTVDDLTDSVALPRDDFTPNPDLQTDLDPADAAVELADSGLSDGADGVPADAGDWGPGDGLSFDVDTDLCMPDCEGKKCGPDGCGGQCGVCPVSKPVCSFGECKTCKPDCGTHECGPDGCGGSCGSCPSKFACVAGLCKAPACLQQQTLFLETFDSCTQGAFDIIDYQPDDSVTWWALPLKNSSPPCALFLGDPGSLVYDTGGSVHLKLVSPNVTLPPGIAWRLTVRLFFELEPVPSPLYPYDYDVLYLRFIAEPGGAATALWSTKEDLNTSDSKMKLLNLDLSALAGMTGRFELEFDTVDSIANEYPGIYLDDFRIDVICPYCQEADECADTDSCSQDSCVPFANFPEVGGCWHEPLADCCADKEPAFCDDQDPCTLDACNPDSLVCSHEPVPGCDEPEPPPG